MAGVPHMRSRSRHGYVMQDFLLCLMIVVTMAQIVVSSLSVFLPSMKRQEEVQDMIAIAQLQKTLMISDDFTVGHDSLRFSNQGREMILHIVNGNLIIQPGTQFILVDVDSVSFYEDGNLIVCVWERNGNEYERVIALS